MPLEYGLEYCRTVEKRLNKQGRAVQSISAGDGETLALIDFRTVSLFCRSVNIQHGYQPRAHQCSPASPVSS